MAKHIAALAFILAPFNLHAHPHAWIDVQSTVVMSDEGFISAIEEKWLFDELYSAAILDGLKNDSPEKSEVVKDFAAEVINNLGPYGYFTRVTENDRVIQLNAVTEYKSELKGEQLQLSFTVPLAEPVDPRGNSVSYSVYDPTYFIHMAHRPEDPPTIKSEKAHSCQAHVMPPNPSPEDFTRAFSLDRYASPSEELGHLFAEKVHAQCK